MSLTTDPLSGTTADFRPDDYEDVLAAFCARTYLLDKYPEGPWAAVTDPRVTDAVRATDRPVFPAAVLFAADTPDTAGDLPVFCDRFRDVSPTLRLGALCTSGLGATHPGFSDVDDGDLAARLTAAWDTQQTLGLNLENMAHAGSYPYTLERAVRLLTVPPTPAAAQRAADLARPHIDWACRAYLTALDLQR